MAEPIESIAERIVRLARRVEADTSIIGVLSTGEACAVALILDRLDLLNSSYRHPFDALDRIGPDLENALRALHRAGWPGR